MSAMARVRGLTRAPQLRRPPSRSLMVAATVIAATTIAWLRLPPVARDTLWAEDGRTFLGGAAGLSPWTTIFQPYAGYLHVIPRLIALTTVSVVPVTGWALSMTFLSCLVAGAVAGVVLLVSRPYVRWLPGRLLLAGLTVLTPLASREVLGNAANVHSILFWGAFWMLLARPSNRRSGGTLAAAVLLCVLTEIQTLLLVPLLLYRLRDRLTWPVKAAVAAGVTAQLVATISAPRPHNPAPQDDPVSIAFGWVINGTVTSWIPRASVGGAVAAWGPGLAILLLIPAASIAISLAWGRREQRLVSLALLAEAVAVWTASVFLNPAPFYDYAAPGIADSGHVWLTRYGVVPAMMLLAESVIAIDVIRERGTGGRRAAIGLAVGIAIVLTLQAPTSDTRRSDGPEWIPQIAAAATRCEDGATTIKLQETLRWTVAVPCRYFGYPSGSATAKPAPRATG